MFELSASSPCILISYFVYLGPFVSAKNVDVGPDPVHINKRYQNFILLVANNNISADAMCVRPGLLLVEM